MRVVAEGLRERESEARTVAPRFDGPVDGDAVRAALERAREHVARMASFPPEASDPGTPLTARTEIRGEREAGLAVKPCVNPARRRGLGASGQFVKVRARRPFAFATIRFKLDARTVARIEPDTILVARWDPHDRRFRPVPQSGYNVRHGYAFAQVTRPGIYTAVGLPRDPRAPTPNVDLLALLECP